MMQQTSSTEDNISPFMPVEEVAKMIYSPVGSVYVWTSNTGSQGGQKRKRFPKDLYVRLGRKVLFIRSKFVEWIMNGAEFEGGS